MEHLKLIESIGIKVNNIHLFAVYLPGKSNDYTINNFYIRDINILNGYKNKFIMGDLNSKHTSWNCHANNKAGNLLYNVIAYS